MRPKYKRIIKIINPYGSRRLYLDAYFLGKIPVKILEPSKGGIGTKLKTANAKLTKIIATNKN